MAWLMSLFKRGTSPLPASPYSTQLSFFHKLLIVYYAMKFTQSSCPCLLSVSSCRNSTKTGIFALSTDISWHLEQHLFEGINQGSSETTMDTRGSVSEVSLLTSSPQFIKPSFPTTYNPVLKKTSSFWEEQLSEVNTI